MFYTYVLKSTVSGDLYIGSCQDLKVRFDQHNLGKTRSTRAYRPWLLIYYEAYRDKRYATKREKQLKNHAAKNNLRMQLKYSLEGD
ncbi:TPA: excinuclease ABC subunit C [Patescibacteria group bacterium]|uniref:GIY-YIG catalytic domain protein n=1 Tax=Candidatus Gottesmanbacteria bacterium GW2011_GWA1_43_11 TaxID=1618436 RepID=A0A0G1CGA3_9BACT|nr:MAG: GIY-YIG catalytic domain protein [Candidatus Gottesmanbacteria bacterium GW2011_GWA1_43_11]HCS78283.1 excinuclease ABC subunit C [Patescibacteria group bacterium]